MERLSVMDPLLFSFEEVMIMRFAARPAFDPGRIMTSEGRRVCGAAEHTVV